MSASASPGFTTPLNQQELALLGELTAILGQVDDQMVTLVAYLLKVDRPAANRIMGSSKVSDNSMIWSETIRNRTSDENTLWLVQVACKEIQEISKGRNDFVHAVFSDQVFFTDDGASAGGYLSGGIWERHPPFARRVRNMQQQRPVTDLQQVRDQAVYLLNLLRHVDHVIAGNPADTSPWRERLSPSLPPRPEQDATRTAKGRRARRKS